MGEAEASGSTPPLSYVGGNAVGDIQRRVSGVSAHVLMSMMTLFLNVSARPQPQPGALAFVELRWCSGCRSRRRSARQTTASRSGCGCTGGRSATAWRRHQQGTGTFHGRKQHHRLFEVVREVVAVVEALIALGPVTAVAIDRGLRRTVDGEALLRSHGRTAVRHRALALVTVIPVVPIATFTSSGLSSNSGNSRSTMRARNHRAAGRHRLGVAF